MPLSWDERPYVQATIEHLENGATHSWNSPEKLFEILVELEHRSGLPRQAALMGRVEARLRELEQTYFSWPTTDAPRAGGGQLKARDWVQDGLLSYLGYRVGAKAAPELERHSVLDAAYTSIRASTASVANANEWGDAGSKDRLHKLARSIAALCRNHKRQYGGTTAVEHWEDDLRYLKSKYYDGHYSFQWPAT